MAESVIEKKRFTYEDYLKTPDEERYELIDGDLLMTPAPIPNHQRISGRLYLELTRCVIERGIGELFYAPCDVYLDDENVVQPDVFFISTARLHTIGPKNIQGAPDVVIEIISEKSAYRDLVQKKILYARFGIKEYWIVAPDQEYVEVYTLKEKMYSLHGTYGKQESLESPSFKDLRIELSKIF